MQHDEQAILESRQIVDVDDQPGEPSDDTREPEAATLQDRSATSNRRHLPLVRETKIGMRLSPGQGTDTPGQIAPLLERGRSHPRQRFSIRPGNMCLITGYEDFGMTLQAEVRPHHDSPLVIEFAPQVFTERGCSNPGGPEHSAALQAFGSDPHSLGIDASHGTFGPDLDAEAFEISHGATDEFCVEGRKYRGPGFDQDHSSLRRIDLAEILGQGKAAHLSDRTSEFDPCRPSPDDHECQQCPFALGIRFLFRFFECGEHPPSYFCRLLESFEPRRELLPLFISEVGVAGTARQHQVVVRMLARVRLHHAPFEIDTLRTLAQDPHIARVGEDAANRCGDLRRAQSRRGHLVEQGLKEMVIAFVKQRDIDVGPIGEAFGCIEPGESASDNHYALCHFGSVPPSPAGSPHALDLPATLPDMTDGPALPAHFFDRQDEQEDSVFYVQPRFVVHIDEATISALTEAYREWLLPGAAVLDLMSSWVSHLPQEMSFARVAGLGMNLAELAGNPRLNDHVVHDLNRSPELPYPDQSFDFVINAVSVQYLTRPVEVFRSVIRVLKPGGLSLVAMSHRCFPTKAIRAFHGLLPTDRIELVQSYFRLAGGYDEAEFIDRSPQGADPLWIIAGRRAK